MVTGVRATDPRCIVGPRAATPGSNPKGGRRGARAGALAASTIGAPVVTATTAAWPRPPPVQGTARHHGTGSAAAKATACWRPRRRGSGCAPAPPPRPGQRLADRPRAGRPPPPRRFPRTTGARSVPTVPPDARPTSAAPAPTCSLPRTRRCNAWDPLPDPPMRRPPCSPDTGPRPPGRLPPTSRAAKACCRCRCPGCVRPAAAAVAAVPATDTATLVAVPSRALCHGGWWKLPAVTVGRAVARLARVDKHGVYRPVPIAWLSSSRAVVADGPGAAFAVRDGATPTATAAMLMPDMERVTRPRPPTGPPAPPPPPPM